MKLEPEKYICPSCGKISGIKLGMHGIDTHYCINCKDAYGVMYIAGFNDGLSQNTKECPDDCKQLKGRSCLLSTNHCVRRAEDYYCKKEA